MNLEQELIKEAKLRGYQTGTIIDYKGMLSGTDRLGSGEFKLENGNLIKFEKGLDDCDNQNFRRFDTIWSKNKGWTEIVVKQHGLHMD